ncbi:helix-turn-helix transcriptional regulator [Aequorivita sinensis]|uniref:helix-turn-helix transcriptional regulator n=1 Tax=Aequorivita sinensis TaxID=1382458 RepID=UPI00111D8B75|nr:WYL domain-containing protein [Aequorivita sinensis]
MSLSKIIIRHNAIINKLRRQKQATFAEICDYLKRESDIRGEDLCISKRTFIRDIDQIGEVYGIYIKYDFSLCAYRIEEDLSDDLQKRRLEAFDIFNALKIKERQEKHILLDTRQSTGTAQLYDLLHAINKHLQVSFSYQTFYHENAIERTVKPLAIKEFKYRWYLFAQSTTDEKVKCYGLDRMSNLQISNTNFVPLTNYNLSEELKYCFGIVSPNAEKPSDIVLSFNPFNGLYIKTLPLHHTQQILLDTADELRISLKLYLTDDFIMELLSYGDKVKVLQPEELANKLRTTYENALCSLRKLK